MYNREVEYILQESLASIPENNLAYPLTKLGKWIYYLEDEVTEIGDDEL